MNKVILTTVFCLCSPLLLAMDGTDTSAYKAIRHALIMHVTQTIDPQTSRAKCEAIVKQAVKQGAQDFTKAMITNLAKQLVANKQFKDRNAAKRCIIAQLKEMRIPFQF